MSPTPPPSRMSCPRRVITGSDRRRHAHGERSAGRLAARFRRFATVTRGIALAIGLSAGSSFLAPRLATTARDIMRRSRLRLAARVLALEVAQPLRRLPVDRAGAAMEVGELRRRLVDPLGRLTSGCPVRGALGQLLRAIVAPEPDRHRLGREPRQRRLRLQAEALREPADLPVGLRLDRRRPRVARRHHQAAIVGVRRLGSIALQAHVVPDERRRLALQPGQVAQELRPLRRILDRPDVGLELDEIRAAPRPESARSSPPCEWPPALSDGERPHAPPRAFGPQGSWRPRLRADRLVPAPAREGRRTRPGSHGRTRGFRRRWQSPTPPYGRAAPPRAPRRAPAGTRHRAPADHAPRATAALCRSARSPPGPPPRPAPRAAGRR